MMERRKNLNDKFGFVDLMKIKDFIDYEQPNEYIVESDRYSNGCSTPVLTAGQSFILGYTNESKGIYKKGPCIIFDDFTTSVHYVDFPFKVKSSAMKILTIKSNAYLKYCYYLLLSLSKMPPNHKRQWISTTSEMNHVLPSMDRQISIVKQLDLISDTIVNYTNQIENLDNLVKARFIEMFGDPVLNERKFPTLSGADFFKLSNGRAVPDEKRIETGIPAYGGNGISWYTDEFLMAEDTIVVGRVGFQSGNVHYVIGPLWITDNAMYISQYDKDKFNLRFLYELMQHVNFSRFQDTGDLKKITQKPFMTFKYILPSMDLQQKFVNFKIEVDKSRFNIKKSIIELEREVVYD